jgi:hypothetical protein
MLVISRLISNQFPDYDGLQDTVLQQNYSWKNPSTKYLQFLHVNNCHWILIANTGEFPMNVVQIYDSLYTSVSNATKKNICNFVNVAENELVLKVMNVQQQSDGSSCGVFAAAFAVSLAFGCDPTHLIFFQIREHLASCLQAGNLERFPSKEIAVSNSVLTAMTIPVFCECRMPDDGNLMIQCHKCDILYHADCVGLVKKPSKQRKWLCIRCT